ncbi:MAG: DUF4129 domain-containing protein, partial [Planctomyces sp.]
SVQIISLQDPTVVSDAEIVSAGEDVMSRTEFRSVRRRVLEKIDPADFDRGFLENIMGRTGEVISTVLDAVGDFFRMLFGSRKPPAAPQTPATNSSGSSSLDWLSQLLVIIVIGIVLIIVVMLTSFIIRRGDRRRRESSGIPELSEDDPTQLSVPPGELPANVYESRAVQLAAEGNFRGAVRELLLGSMSWIERAGMVRYRRGLTNRDYVRSVWRRRDKRDAFAVIALEFERIFYGRREANEKRYLHCLQNFRGAFREEEQPTAAV